MRILQINSVYDYGSTGRIVKSIHEKALENGFDSKVVYGRDMNGKKFDTNIYKISSNLDNKIHGVLSRIFDSHGLHSKSATRKLIKYIKEYKPDIIHLHNIHGYYVNYKILFKFLKTYNKPIVWTLHDCWSFTGHCAYYDFVKCAKWQNGCEKCPQKKSYPKSFVDKSKKNYKLKTKLYVGMNITICTPSTWLSQEVEKSILSKVKINVINNGIDLNNYQVRKSNFIEKNGLEGKMIILGVASMWEERKGISAFLKLSKMLDESFEIILVGQTDIDLSSYKNIFYVKRTDSIEELVDIYNSSDVFFNPTLEDNYPTVNIEAISCGVPIITYDTGGSPEVINSKNGFVVKVNDLDSVVEKLHEIKNGNYNREEISKDSIQYSQDSKFTEYIDLYKSLNKEEQ